MSNTIKRYDVVIIGAGAAGLFCAIHALKRGRKVAILEHNSKPGAKILVSGGGRCNFTNLGTTSDNFVSQNPHFCKSALSRFTSHHFLEWVQNHEISYVEKKPGQLFCERSAKDLLEGLLKDSAKADFYMETHIKASSVEKQAAGFFIPTSQGDFHSETLVIATGGLSLPQIGATGFGYDIAKQFGLSIVPTAPALDGFLGDTEFQKQWKSLSGISVPVKISSGKTFQDNLLITHLGLSGPAALQASLYWKQGQCITIDWCADTDLEAWFLEKKLHGEKKNLKNILSLFWPIRLTEHLSKIFQFPTKPLCEISSHDLKALACKIKSWSWNPAFTVGYARAEVTRGGVHTDHFSSKTLECRTTPGLFFCGEVLDVTGELGGYNFQWAWSSAYAVGENC